MWQSTYSPIVRIGNWLEDMAREEVELTMNTDGHVRFGDIIQIKSVGDPSKFNFGFVRKDCVLSVNCDTDALFKETILVPPCLVTGSRVTSPCLSNSFKITSGREIDDGQKILYNQVFYLKTLDNIGGHLYLQSDRYNFDCHSKRARHQKVFFGNNTMYLAKWRILYHKQGLRLEFDHMPVCINHKVVINHVYTNQNLNVEDTSRLVSFEYKTDYEVSVFTNLDQYKTEKEQNRWYITLANPEGVPCPKPKNPKDDTKSENIPSLPTSMNEKMGLVHDLQKEQSMKMSQYILENAKPAATNKTVCFADEVIDPGYCKCDKISNNTCDAHKCNCEANACCDHRPAK
ncbi:cilia- and flagella-associated protein 161-like [Argonauta hians]